MPAGFQWMIIGLGILTVTALALRRKNRKSGMGVDLTTDRDRAKETRESMEEIFVRLSEFSRETLAKLDMRIRMLNELLARADAKIAALQGNAAPPAPPPKSSNPLHEKVFSLSDQGKNVFEIGDATGLKRGEVELILGLREKRP